MGRVGADAAPDAGRGAVAVTMSRTPSGAAQETGVSRGRSRVNVEPGERVALDRQRPPVRERNLAADVEAKPQAADPFCGRQPLEGLEDPAVIGAGNPHPHVLDADADAVPDRLNRQRNRLPHTVLDRVRDQVRHHLFEPAAVPGTDDRCGDHQLDRRTDLRRLLAQPAHHLAQQLDDVDALDPERKPPGGQPRDVEEVVHQPAQSIGSGAGGREGAGQLSGLSVVRRQPLAHSNRRAEAQLERRERRLELVRGDGDELVARPDRRAALGQRGRQRQHADRRDARVALHQQQALVRRFGAEDPVARGGA